MDAVCAVEREESVFVGQHAEDIISCPFASKKLINALAKQWVVIHVV